MYQYITRYGAPRTFHSDRGANFLSNLFQDMCRILGIHTTQTTSYHAMGNGETERMNRTILQMLRIMGNERYDDWDEILPFVLCTYRNTPHESTGHSPYYLVHGREATLPVDVIFGNPPRGVPPCATEYGEWLRESLQMAHQDARRHLKKAAERQKNYFDARYTPHPYQTGEFVWRYVAKPARRKLTKGWTGPYRIVSVPNDQHCFLQKGPGLNPVRVHCDQLKPYLGRDPRGWGKGSAEAAALGGGTESSESSGNETEEDGEHPLPPEIDSSGSSAEETVESETSVVPPENAAEKEPVPPVTPALGRGKRTKKPPDRYDW